MDAEVGQAYLSLGPQSSKSENSRRALKGILGFVAFVVGVALSALMLSSRDFIDDNEMLELFTLPGVSGGIKAPLQARKVMISTGPANKWKQLALTAIDAANRCNRPGVRDLSMQQVMSSMDKQSKTRLARLADEIVVRAEAVAENMSAPAPAPPPPLKMADLPGVSGPLGFFDPVGFSADTSDGKLLFYREVELKHSRLCMLASLGILVAEKFHPLFGGNIDVPAAFAFQQTPLQKFWYVALSAVFAAEIASIQSFQALGEGGALWEMRPERTPGDFGFDPLGLKPSNKAEFEELQTKELNNGRLAMFATAGMIAQELATGKTIF